MAFNTWVFLLFFVAVISFYRATRSAAARRVTLLAASYGFYALFSLPLLTLVIVSTLTDFLVARRMALATGTRRRALLLVSLAINLGLLAFFKYLDFAIESLAALLGLLGTSTSLVPLELAIPLGISFYTFQTLGYTIDVYRGNQEPTGDLLAFATYVAFFPQLVAGPIERASHLLPQCQAPPPLRRGQTAVALSFVAFGLFKKCVIADSMAPIVERVFAHSSQATLLDAWVGMYGFGVQIFCDFSGYCDLAVGIALLLGFHLSDNFHSPYAAHSFSEFWRRWHVTLSRWLRDYLYIPLGGNRKGRARTYLNLLLTMLLGGLWHGAGWNFLIWGALHGAYLAIERAIGWGSLKASGSAGVVRSLLVLQGVMLAWIFFRAQDLESALTLCRSLVTGSAGVHLTGGSVLTVGFVSAALLVFHQLTREVSFEARFRELPSALRGIWIGCLLAMALLLKGTGEQFIYFQF